MKKAIATLIALVLAGTACGGSSQTFLTIGLDAIETLTQQLVQDYAPNSPQAQTVSADLTTFIADVQTTLGSGTITAAELTTLGAEGAAIVKAGVPAGTPQTIAGVIQLALNAVSAYLQNLAAAKTTVTAALPALSQSFYGGAPVKIKLSSKDKKTLAAIKAKNDALKAKLATIKK